MLRGLIGHRHAGPLGQLPGPHASAVHDVLALDVALLGADPDDATVPGQDIKDWSLLQNRHTLHARTLGQRHRRIDGVDPTILWDVEPREQVIGACDRKEIGNLARGDLVNVDAAVSIQG